MHIDDNPDARALLSILLEQEEDLEEVGSQNSAEGLDKVIQETSPDVLLIDLTMQGKDPVEAIQETRAAFPALRIVVLSASRDPRLLDRARRAGASQITLKGLGFTETLEAIRGSTG